MLRTLTPASSLDELKRGAKRWLRALQENDAEARARYERALPDGPPAPTLRTVQLALARALGFPGWTELKRHAEQSRAAAPRIELDALVDRFLDNACPDHHVRGRVDHLRAQHTALRLLAHHPELRHASFITDVVCGDLARVTNALATDPSLATRRAVLPSEERSDSGGQGDVMRRDFGPKGWDPLLYLCFTRLPLEEVSNHAVAIAHALLEHGANAASFFMAGGSRYTPLVGAVGEGEEDRPPHQRRDELVRLLLDHGADPFDGQVTYNIHFHGNVLWFLKLSHEYSVKAGRASVWDDPQWAMIDMGGYGQGARWYLTTAIRHGDVELAKWCLEHGASPNAAPPRAAHLPQASLYEFAMRRGETAIADLLVKHGSNVTSVELTAEERFEVACMRLDADAARLAIAERPELLKVAQPLHEAARRNRADVVRFLLDLGVSPDVENAQKERALHAAASSNAVDAARVVIERGAEIDPREGNWSNTPLGAAAYYQNQGMMDLLAPYSRDVWELTAAGKLDRLRELFAESPERARVTWEGNTPLMWVTPADERLAISIARLFLAYGADPGLMNAEGATVADRAERLGMFELAALMRDAAGEPGRYATLARYEEMAANLLAAYRTGTPEAMERHWKDTWHRRSWAAMRRYVQLDLGRRAESEEGGGPPALDPAFDITMADARFLIARQQRQSSWVALADHVTSLPPGTKAARTPVILWSRTASGHRSKPLAFENWDVGLERLASLRLPGVDVQGPVTAQMLRQLVRHEHITALGLAGARGLDSESVRLIAQMPWLRELDLPDSSVSDRDLAVLAALPALERINLSNTSISDAGAKYLGRCERLERVDLSWTATGDGAIRALANKAALRYLHSGHRVTDAGIALLHDIPAFERWHGGDPRDGVLDLDRQPNHLVLRGSFTDRGLAAMAGLDGLFGLDIADVNLTITPRGLAPLTDLNHLSWLGVEAVDESMPYIAAMPVLRGLMCQDTPATDDGFEALARSMSIEAIWGRRCHGLRDRGFIALSTMPVLRQLAVSCRNVGDAGLATLPDFPALRDLMPMDVPDECFRFIARCTALDTLTLMYCRDTTDRATELITVLPKLRRYFASYTQITNRTPELLSGMHSLEEVELSSCAGVTNEGAVALARLPRLQKVRLSGMPGVTPEVVAAFRPDVDVDVSF